MILLVEDAPLCSFLQNQAERLSQTEKCLWYHVAFCRKCVCVYISFSNGQCLLNYFPFIISTVVFITLTRWLSYEIACQI